jgi:hypothetical protein
MGLPLLGEGFQSGLPVVNWAAFQPGLMRDLVIPALNLALVSFVSLMLTARSFAAKMAMKLMLMLSSERWVLRISCLDYRRGLLSVEPIPGLRLMIQLGEKSAGFRGRSLTHRYRGSIFHSAITIYSRFCIRYCSNVCIVVID